jgi:hypothetical protein
MIITKVIIIWRSIFSLLYLITAHICAVIKYNNEKIDIFFITYVEWT